MVIIQAKSFSGFPIGLYKFTFWFLLMTLNMRLFPYMHHHLFILLYIDFVLHYNGDNHGKIKES